MRIDWLRVWGFRNLQDFEIDFAEQEATSVLIGENGAGKSNLFEAIVLIFRSLDREEAPPFRYQIRYLCRGRTIFVDGDPGRPEGTPVYQIQVTEAGQKEREIASASFRRRAAELLPAHVFAYYSGPGNRLGQLFRAHRDSFDKNLRRGKAKTGELRRFFYCLPEHSQFVLLSYFIDPKTDRTFLRKYFGIRGFDSSLIVLKKPWWAKSKMREGGDPRFWGALGDVRRFVGECWSHALAPIRVEETVEEGEGIGARREERVYLYLPGPEALHALASSWPSPKAFFAAMESTAVADLIREVQIRVDCGGPEPVTFSMLSEGEQQLLTVVGMLRFTRGEETLFLLDEPDTHLNPKWKLDYLDLLLAEVGNMQSSSQLIVSTHDPLTIAALFQRQVQVFRRDLETREVTVKPPREDPRGLGVVGVLTEMFGLPRTLDTPTLRELDERNDLAANETRSPTESARLRELSDHLGSLGFQLESRDPRINQVLRALAQWEQEQEHAFWEMPVEQQQEVAQRLVRALLGEPATGEPS